MSATDQTDRISRSALPPQESLQARSALQLARDHDRATLPRRELTPPSPHVHGRGSVATDRKGRWP